METTVLRTGLTPTRAKSNRHAGKPERRSWLPEQVHKLGRAGRLRQQEDVVARAVVDVRACRPPSFGTAGAYECSLT